ncbi:MAG: hypothetical protein ACRD1P_13445 [Thermoanaerobaculia bacterium]
MRLPSRTVFAGLGLLAAGALLAQQPPSTPPPVKGGKTALIDREAPTVTRVEPAPQVVTTETAPQPLGYESDVYCFGYLGDLAETFLVRVNGAENIAEQTDYITDNLLYVNGGVDKGLKVGDEFWIVTPEQEVIHPTTWKSLGRFYQYRGRAVVSNLDARAGTVRVTHACTDIPMGAYLKRFEPIPIPLARKSPPAVAGDPPSGKATGHIVYTRDGVVGLGADQDVLVDLGIANGLQPGDFLTIFRLAQGRQYGIRPVGAYWVNLPPAAGFDVPRTYLGEGGVLMVGDRWSVVRVTDSFRLIDVGDEVELK